MEAALLFVIALGFDCARRAHPLKTVQADDERVKCCAVLLSTARVDVLVDDVWKKADDTRLNLSMADKNPDVTLEDTFSFSERSSRCEGF